MKSRSPASVPEPIVIGVVAAPHGVRGTLRVKPAGDGRHLREGVAPLVDGERREIVVSRPTPKGFLIDFDGFTDRSEVEALRGTELILDRSELDEPDDTEVYVSDLVGLEARSASGEKLGVVTRTFQTSAHEILVIHNGEGPELYVPFTLEHVPELSLEAGHITLNPPEPGESNLA